MRLADAPTVYTGGPSGLTQPNGCCVRVAWAPWRESESKAREGENDPDLDDIPLNEGEITMEDLFGDSARDDFVQTGRNPLTRYH